jgi:2-polyprenyl-3-methyl-5-hydroxy-6-metoxy-1,4-benzoquinol methylase
MKPVRLFEVRSRATALRITPILLGVFALLLGIAASYYWLTYTRGVDLLRAAPVTSVRLLVSIAALTSVNLLARWLRWVFLLRRFHVRLPTRHTFLVFFATLPASFTPLYVGEMLRGLLMSWRRPDLLSTMVWVWLAERGSDVAALLVLWGLSTRGGVQLWLGIALLLGVPYGLARSAGARRERPRLHTAQLHPVSATLLSAAITLFAWALPVLGVQLALRGFGSDLGLAQACQAFSRGTLLGAVSGVPGGLAIAGSEMITRLMYDGVPAAQATAAVAVLRLGTHGYAFALGMSVAALGGGALVAMLRAHHAEQEHFDELSSTYAQGIPEHVRRRLLSRKISAMLDNLGTTQQLRGLDLGCGHGWYAGELARHGFRMSGIDLSRGQVAQAQAYCQEQGVDVELSTYDGKHIPYDDASFDFVYCINVLHHVTAPHDQEALLREALRVLRPGGYFFLHEMNVENPVFRVYMSYIFPLLKRIDEGTELWLLPTRLPKITGGTWQPKVVYFTFLPEFIPGLGQRLFAPLERLLERSRFGRYAAHYMAVMRRS